MDQKEILREYKELRRASIRLNARLVRSFGDQELGDAAVALGALHGKYIDLETEDELVVIGDYAIHNIFIDGRNAVDRMLEENPPPEGSNELRLLRSLQRSHYTIFDVQTPIPGFGVRGLDAPKQLPITVVDLGFSATAMPGLALATRIHSPGEGWWMTTGTALPVTRKAADRILHAFENHKRQYGTELTDQETTTIVIRECIAAGASHQINYATPGEEQARPRVVAPISRGEPKIGRNDPCPCGSGKKYKKCCGSAAGAFPGD